MFADPICLFCKSFRDDFTRLEVLLKSIEVHNRDRIPLVVSVPAADRRAFLDRLGTGRCELVTDEELAGPPYAGNGWVHQQIVKMSFWRARRAAAALMLDSDFHFLRDFGRADLIDKDGTPFFVVSPYSHTWEDGAPGVRAALEGRAPLPALSAAECTALAVRSRVPRAWWWRRLFRLRVRDEVRHWFGRRGPPLWFMAGPVVSHGAQETFWTEFVEPSGLSYARLLEGSPFEFQWLGEWLLARRCHDLRPIPPPFVCFRSDEGIEAARALGIGREQIARHYLGAALAARHQTIVEY